DTIGTRGTAPGLRRASSSSAARTSTVRSGRWTPMPAITAVVDVGEGAVRWDGWTLTGTRDRVATTAGRRPAVHRSAVRGLLPRAHARLVALGVGEHPPGRCVAVRHEPSARGHRVGHPLLRDVGADVDVEVDPV